MQRALTIRDLMKLLKTERVRRGKAWARQERKPRPLAQQPAPAPHPVLKRWVKPEKPIEIIG